MLAPDLIELCRDLTFCPDCLDLRGHQQSCRCSQRTAPEVATLCRCCGAELLEGGELWSIWFCEQCEIWVDRLHEFTGLSLVPIGRAPGTLRRGHPWGEGLRRLEARDRRLTIWNLRDLGLDPHADVPLQTYFDALARQPIDRVARFIDLCEAFAIGPDVARALTAHDVEAG